LKPLIAFARLTFSTKCVFLQALVGEIKCACIDAFKGKIDKLERFSKEALTSERLDDEGELEHAERMTLEWLKQNENLK
jgi:hypothetical protein